MSSVPSVPTIELQFPDAAPLPLEMVAIARGMKGDKGDKGDRGDPADAGDLPDLTIFFENGLV